MPVSLHLELGGDVQLHRTLERFTEAVGDMRPAWGAIRDRFVAMERRQFETEGAYASGGWSPLSPRYADWKAAHYPGKTILRRTDELFASLTEGPAVYVAESSFMVIGTDVEYAAFHQRGGPNLPQRRPIELPESERDAWAQIMQNHIMGAALDAGVGAL